MKKNINKNENNIGILTRVSSKGQESDGTSIEYQIRKGNELSKKIDMKPISYNEGGVSSWNSNVNTRPILVKLLTDIEGKRIKNIWVWNLDRLGRNSDSWYTIIKILIGWKVNVYVGESTKPYNFSNSVDKLVIGVLSLISTYDNELRRTRMIFGKKETLKKGRTFIGGEVPFGYDKDKLKNLKPHPQQKKYLKKMFEMYRDGKSTTDIQVMMNQSEFEPKRSKRGWNLGTIQKMLQNTLYVGEQEWVWKEKEPDGSTTIIETIKIKTPKLVSKKLYNDVQKRFEKYNVTNQYSTDLKSLLKGFLVCSHCELPLNHRIKKNEKNDYYYCVYNERSWVKRDKSNLTKYQTQDDTCGMKKSLMMNQTDLVVWEEFLKVISESNWVKEQFKEKGLEPKNKQKKEVKSELVRLRNNLVKLRKQKESLTDSLIEVEVKQLNGEFKSDKVYNGVIKKVDKTLEVVTKDYDEIQDTIKQLKRRNQWINWLGKMKEEVDDMKDWDFEEKREILTRFINKIYVKYNPNNLDHTLSIDFNLPIVDDKIKYSGKYKSDGTKDYVISKGIHKLKIIHKRQTFRPKDQKVEIVQKMISLREEGLSYSEMSVWLNKNEIQPLRSKVWNRGSVGRFYNYLTQNIDYYVNSDVSNRKKK